MSSSVSFPIKQLPSEIFRKIESSLPVKDAVALKSSCTELSAMSNLSEEYAQTNINLFKQEYESIRSKNDTARQKKKGITDTQEFKFSHFIKGLTLAELILFTNFQKESNSSDSSESSSGLTTSRKRKAPKPPTHLLFTSKDPTNKQQLLLSRNLGAQSYPVMNVVLKCNENIEFVMYQCLGELNPKTFWGIRDFKEDGSPKLLGQVKLGDAPSAFNVTTRLLKKNGGMSSPGCSFVIEGKINYIQFSLQGLLEKSELFFK